jgi:hypothetical protein
MQLTYRGNNYNSLSSIDARQLLSDANPQNIQLTYRGNSYSFSSSIDPQRQLSGANSKKTLSLLTYRGTSYTH